MNEKVLRVLTPCYLLFLCFFVSSCNGKPKERKDGIIKKDTVSVSYIDSNYNTIHEHKIYPYKQVDSLIQLLGQEYDKNIMLQLDSICQGSDGDLTEKFYELGEKLLDNHLVDFVNFLSIYDESCLRESTILGISAEISAYGEEERIKIIIQEKDKYLAIAKSKNLSVDLLMVIEKLYAEVRPDLFD